MERPRRSSMRKRHTDNLINLPLLPRWRTLSQTPSPATRPSTRLRHPRPSWIRLPGRTRVVLRPPTPPGPRPTNHRHRATRHLPPPHRRNNVLWRWSWLKNRASGQHSDSEHRRSPLSPRGQSCETLSPRGQSHKKFSTTRHSPHPHRRNNGLRRLSKRALEPGVERSRVSTRAGQNSDPELRRSLLSPRGQSSKTMWPRGQH
mmetsp:Transcript_5844/g.13483  ORF Transcript_5844/g.13483 Transcript_5844/m.13483 type:complete len:203 (-) Transcript_5844:452-1060(-)